MNFLKKLFTYNSKLEHINENDSLKNMPSTLDECFVQNFIKKKGKFLYCTSLEDINQNLLNILKENAWTNVLCYNDSLKKKLSTVNAKNTNQISEEFPFYTKCEHLLADDGSILFSSNQLCGNKITELPENFIVFAKTSQLVKNKGEGLTGIKNKYKEHIPSSITTINSYNPNNSNNKYNDFMSHGNSNEKYLYLLLLEDL